MRCSRTAVLAAVTFATLCGADPAAAAPPAFPDLAPYPAVDPILYQVLGGHPSSSGWAFKTASGLRCQDSLIPDLGIVCVGPIPGVPPGTDQAAVSLADEGTLSQADPNADSGPDGSFYPLLPTGSKMAAGNGVECAAIRDDVLACLARKPDSWPADTVDPPNRHYGEHGFVLTPEGSWVF